MSTRPTEQDCENLEALVAIGDDLDKPSQNFIDEQWLRLENERWASMTPKQWAWFDKLVERWL